MSGPDKTFVVGNGKLLSQLMRLAQQVDKVRGKGPAQVLLVGKDVRAWLDKTSKTPGAFQGMVYIEEPKLGPKEYKLAERKEKP